MITVKLIEGNGYKTSNTAYNTDMCTVMSAENGLQEPSIVKGLNKELDAIGIRNVHCVKQQDITNELTEGYVMLYLIDK